MVMQKVVALPEISEMPTAVSTGEESRRSIALMFETAG